MSKRFVCCLCGLDTQFHDFMEEHIRVHHRISSSRWFDYMEVEN